MKKKYLRPGLPGRRSTPANPKAAPDAEQATSRKAAAKTSKQERKPSADGTSAEGETSAEGNKVSKGADEEME